VNRGDGPSGQPWGTFEIRRIRTVLSVSLVAGITTAVLIALWPAKYEVNASILLDDSGIGTNLLDVAQLSEYFPSGALGSQARSENGYAYKEIVESSTMLGSLLEMLDPSRSHTRVLDRFSAPGGSLEKRAERALRKLRKSISTKFESKPGILKISVINRDPILAAFIANQLIGGLQKFNVETRRTQARDAVVFVQGRLGEARDALTVAEDRLAEFRERNARIGNAPGLLLQQNRLERVVRLSEDIYALLAKQLEIARNQEKWEASVFTIIDSAVPPTRPTGFPPILAGALAGITAASVLSLLAIGSAIQAKRDA
jgi:uncharacterized protein involved in exopolysaccharide biosynthesis